MEPIPLFTDTGCRTGHYAADKQATLRFVFQSDQDYSGRGAPWRRCCCGGGEPWEPLGAGPRAAHAGLGHEARSPPRRLLASEPRGPATLSKPGGGFPRVPTGEAGPEAVDAFGTLGGARCGARHVRVRRQGGGHGRFHPSQPRTGVVTFRRTATEGWRSLSLPGDYWHRSTPGGRLHGRGRAGRAPTSTEGPEAPRRVRSPRECVGRVRRSTGRRVHPSPQADGFNGHNVVVELGPVGAGRLAVAGY